MEKRRKSWRFRLVIAQGLSRLGLLAFALGAWSCGEEKEEVRREAEVPGGGRLAAAGNVVDELVALQFRTVRADDRLVTGAGLQLTVIQQDGLQEPSEVADEIASLEPGADWRLEELSVAVSKELKRVFSEEGSEVVGPEFVCSELRPGDMEREEIRGGYAIRRPKREEFAKGVLKGRDGLEQEMTKLRSGFEGEPEVSIKVIAIDVGDGEVTTRALVELRGRAAQGGGGRQVSATWRADWEDETPPKLLELELLQYEESIVEAKAGFVDVTRQVLGATPHFEAQVLTGIDYWASRLTRLGDFSLTGHHGLAVGDVNGDGLEDLFVCDGGSLPNRLYVQQADGKVRDVSGEAGVDWFEDSRSALLVDLDNDGDQDLVVATIAMIVFAENDGTGKFRLCGGHPGARYPFSLSAADVDSDGDLDIHACVYGADDNVAERGFAASSPLPFNDATNGGRNLLLRNLGHFRFSDATAEVGLDQDNTRWSFAAGWEDFDRDGDPDLYVANDFGRNCLYRNEGGRFRQIAAEMGVEDMASGMSVAWGDYNRDGAADLYVGNMFSAAGSRVSYQRRFSTAAEGKVVQSLQRMARGNSLFEANGVGGFREVSESTRTYLGGWAWSSGFVDVNNDGWEDLAVTNGFLTGRRPDDL